MWHEIFADWRFFFCFFTKLRDRIKNSDHEEFSLRKEKKRCVQKRIVFIHFRRNDPQSRRYLGERITWLLIIWQFIVFWTVSSRIQLLVIKQENVSLRGFISQLPLGFLDPFISFYQLLVNSRFEKPMPGSIGRSKG